MPRPLVLFSRIAETDDQFHRSMSEASSRTGYATPPL
jgi:hypothetical protein